MNWEVQAALDDYRNAASRYIETQKRMFVAEATLESASNGDNPDRYDAAAQELFNATIADIEAANSVIVEKDILEHLIKLDVAGRI